MLGETPPHPTSANVASLREIIQLKCNLPVANHKHGRPSTTIRTTRLWPAIVHLIQLVCACLLLIGPGSVLAVVYTWMTLAPFFATGLFTSGKRRGSPRGCLFRRRLPYAIPMSLLVELPISLFFSLYLFIGLLFIHPLAHVAFELLNVLSCGRLGLINLKDKELPDARRPTDDLEAPMEAPHRIAESLTPSVGSDAPNSSIVRHALRTSELLKSAASRYRTPDAVWDALEGGALVQAGDVRLLRLTWLMDLANPTTTVHQAYGGVLPRRQDLPEEAFMSVEELKGMERSGGRGTDKSKMNQEIGLLSSGNILTGIYRILASITAKKNNVDGLLPIIAVSYCWLDIWHPDAEGEQLKLLIKRLGELNGGRGLLAACRAYGYADMGVFLDWGSLYQKDPKLWKAWMNDVRLLKQSDEELAASRTEGKRLVAERAAYDNSRDELQKAAFGRGLKHTMDLWYGHSGTTVVLLTMLPHKLPKGFDTSRTYDSRGWTTFERCSAELAKSFNLQMAKWGLVIDVSDKAGRAQRRLPTTPKCMATLLEKRNFTNGADKQAVLELYDKVATAVLCGVEKLDYLGLPLEPPLVGESGDVWCSPMKLADALNYCVQVKEIDLRGTGLTDDGLEQLVAGLEDTALPKLKVTLGLGSNHYGARGVVALCNAFARGVAANLEVVWLDACQLGDEGATALALQIGAGHLPKQLKLITVQDNSIHNEGALALASALAASSSSCKISLSNNAIGLRGQSALLRVFESVHGMSLAHVGGVHLMNPPCWPPCLMRALFRGARATYEDAKLMDDLWCLSCSD